MERRGGYFWITSFFRRFICSEEWKRFRLILGNVVRSKKEGILVGPSSCDTKSKNRKRLDLKRQQNGIEEGECTYWWSKQQRTAASIIVLSTYYMLGIKSFTCVNSFNLCKNFNVSKYMKIEIKVAGVGIENLGEYMKINV